MALNPTAVLRQPQAARTLNWAALWQYALFLAVAAAVLLPLSFLVLGSFSTARLPGEFSLDQMGWVNYLKVWTDPQTYAVFYNTLVYVLGSTALGIGAAAVLAGREDHTNTPGNLWISPAIPMTLAMPALLQA